MVGVLGVLVKMVAKAEVGHVRAHHHLVVELLVVVRRPSHNHVPVFLVKVVRQLQRMFVLVSRQAVTAVGLHVDLELRHVLALPLKAVRQLQQMFVLISQQAVIVVGIHVDQVPSLALRKVKEVGVVQTMAE